MSITSAVCNSWKLETIRGEHQAADVYKLALIKAGHAGTFNKSTTNYSDLGADEVVGAGYSAGGVTLAGYTSTLTGDVASVDFSDATWDPATLSADGALLYNATLGGAAVAVLSFADVGAIPVSSTNAAFTVEIPSAGVGLVRIA